MAYDPLSQDVHPIDYETPASSSLLTFLSHGLRLNGRIFMAQGNHLHPTALILHGYPGVEQNHDIAHALRRMGWNAVIFHYRGAWGSEGEFSVANALDDVAVAVDYLTANAPTYRIDPNRLVLIGHSMGGFAALLMGAKLPQIRAVVSLACFNFGGYAHYLQEDDYEDEARLWDMDTSPLNGMTGMKLIQEVVAHRDEWDLVNAMPLLAQRPVCLISGQRDFVSPPAVHYVPLLEALAKAGSVQAVGHTLDADHSFSDHRVALTRLVLECLGTL